MNRTQLVGRLTKDPEIRYTQSNKAVASFTLAVNRRSKDDGADFISCIAWDKTAELLGKWTHKGDRLGVCGRIQTRNYEKDGRKVYVTEVVADEVEFLQGRNEQQEQQANQTAQKAQDMGFTEVEVVEDLPF